MKKYFAAIMIGFLSGCQQVVNNHPYLGISERSISSQHDSYSKRGPFDFTVSEKSIVSSTGCKLSYQEYTPIGTTQSQPQHDILPIVMVLHGLHRSAKNMTGYGEHLASKGLNTLVVNECSKGIWSKRFEHNHVSFLALSKHLDRPIIYVGFSGGGLAAFISASSDSNAVAFLGLDMGGWKDIGLEEMKSIKIPVAGIFGPPKLCNIKGRGAFLMSQKENAYVHYLPDSRHCHFENPYSHWCRFACGKGEINKDRHTLKKEIMKLTTAFVLWQSGVDPKGQALWANAHPLKSVDR